MQRPRIGGHQRAPQRAQGADSRRFARSVQTPKRFYNRGVKTSTLRRRLRVLSLCMGLLMAVGAAHASDWPAINKAMSEQAWDQAASLIDTGLQEHPRDARLRLLQGMVLAKKGRLPEAQTRLTQLSTDHPELSEAHNNLGIVLALQNQWPAALRAFERARLADPSNAAAVQNLHRAQAQWAKQQAAASK